MKKCVFAPINGEGHCLVEEASKPFYVIVTLTAELFRAINKIVTLKLYMTGR